MDIKLPHSLLKEFLDTKAKPEKIAESISLCGPTVDRLHKTNKETIYDIEIITNRVDSASAFGVAREAAAILPEFDIDATLKNNPYELTLKELGELPSNRPVTVQILDNSLIPRFTAISLTNVEIKDSPQQTQDWLKNSGQRPLNNIIDITNELTLKYGQPVHVFDLDKIAENQMILRESKKGEKILTLDGRTHTLRGGDIVIQDGAGNLIDLCGIMGGGLSDVDENTKNVLLFVQTYEPKHIRKTSLYTQERTLASQIFEKNPDSELVLPVLVQGVKLLQERANATISSGIIDIYNSPPQTRSIKLDLNWLNSYIGIDISKTKAVSILNRLGFKTKATGDTLTVTIPTWRLHEVSIKEDLAEEITRVYGYFRLPSILPTTTLPAVQTDPLLDHEYRSRQYLAALGFTEIYNIALVGKNDFDRANLKLDDKLKLNNPLSNEYEYLRTSLIPSLLMDLENNRGKVEPPLRIFELANIYHSSGKTLPEEVSTLSLTTYGLDFPTTKGYLEALAQHLHLELAFKALDKDQSPFIKSQSATIHSGKNILGTIGTISPSITSNFSLTKTVVIVELNFLIASKHIDPIHHFKPVPQFASIFEDVTITSTKPVGEILKPLKTADPLIHQVTYLTSHQNKHTFRIEFNDSNDNLTQEQVNQIKSKLQK